MDLREIGRVSRLQVQRAPLKVGQKPHRVYDPSPLLSVARASVSSSGMTALPTDGQSVVDVHHVRHPQSQNAGSNGISFGFTPNYARMRERFGDHLADGCAGENILIETNLSLGLADLQRGVAIRLGSSETYLWLRSIVIARPCVEFSRHALRQSQVEKDSQVIQSTLQFLGNGVRGFYATPVNPDDLVVSIGDRVFLSSADPALHEQFAAFN